MPESLDPRDPSEVPSDETPKVEEQEQEEDFASLLAAEGRIAETPEPRAGDKVEGRIVQIGPEDAFVDFGGRSELPLSLTELAGPDGTPTLNEGDAVTAWVTGEGAEQRLTLRQKMQGKDTTMLEEAMASGVPLSGTVTETNKGGFVVDIGGFRAFCPISQIDDRYVEDPQPYVGRSLEFRVIEFAEGGRRLVVSRRALLREERDRKGAETRRDLAPGSVYDGVVTRLMPFGAFVDIGGVEGLVHISEISHGRVSHPGDALEPGQEVKVKVLDVQNLGQGRNERISLSMRALEGDPWAEAVKLFPLGAEVPGRVTGLAEFGAFVELAPGLQGLVHISMLSEERIHHPSEVVQEGQEVTVRVLELDPERKRISLSLVQ